MNILALDLATKTGFACLVNGTRHSGEWNCRKRFDESIGAIFVKFEGHLRELERDLGLTLDTGSEGWDVVAFERAHLRGAAATGVVGGLIATLQRYVALRHLDAAVLSIGSGDIKEFAIGKRRGDKTLIIAAVNERFAGLYPDGATDNDNIADARALLEIVLEKKGLTP